MKKQIKRFTKPDHEITLTPPEKKNKPEFITKESLLLFIIAFICYGASVLNGYALDDFIVLVKNKFVQNGIAGIGNIFTIIPII